mmetsp:Transcript_27179/g.65351  ORF Transcript_27179/g.65351 Transcript_27179/m.65351 type:complete len:82 (+) Transcript_27179:824-1069(+)
MPMMEGDADDGDGDDDDDDDGVADDASVAEEAAAVDIIGLTPDGRHDDRWNEGEDRFPTSRLKRLPMVSIARGMDSDDRRL